jgi:hypothetical protein
MDIVFENFESNVSNATIIAYLLSETDRFAAIEQIEDLRACKVVAVFRKLHPHLAYLADFP